MMYEGEHDDGEAEREEYAAEEEAQAEAKMEMAAEAEAEAKDAEAEAEYDMSKVLYCYLERGSYDPLTGWGYFASDKEAIEAFKKDIKNSGVHLIERDYYIGKLIRKDGISQDPPTAEVCILKGKEL